MQWASDACRQSQERKFQNTCLPSLKTIYTIYRLPYFSGTFCMKVVLLPEDGGTSQEVNVRIQKARGSLSKLRSVWLSKSLRKGTKIRKFNACVKSVLLYGCGTWLVTKDIQRKLQTFVNRCLRYILRIWWPNLEVRHPRCVGSIKKNFVYYTYSQKQLYFTY